MFSLGAARRGAGNPNENSGLRPEFSFEFPRPDGGGFLLGRFLLVPFVVGTGVCWYRFLLVPGFCCVSEFCWSVLLLGDRVLLVRFCLVPFFFGPGVFGTYHALGLPGPTDGMCPLFSFLFWTLF